MSNATEFDPYAMPSDAIQDPPVSLWEALKKIGPGIILAGTIVGSGELLVTTSLGAKHGFDFLWLILFSCVIKVFVQIELGRYAISSGRPTLGAINELGGFRFGAHWIVWCWFLMMLATIFQHGAMVGTVGQSLNLVFPSVSQTLIETLPIFADAITKRPELPWAFLTCLTAITLLWSGSYRRIEFITTCLVVGVTLITLSAACALPFTKFPIPWMDVAGGMTFKLPSSGIAVAFSVFGITGVGATELFYYPYWCLEKGYARFTGQRDDSEAWAQRAKGWMRVMHFDAWISMVVFTISTLAFYFMGATVLKPQGLDPKGSEMIEVLSRMFVDTFGDWTRVFFLIGAGAVLFKTHYIASAGNARLTTDFLSLSGVLKFDAPSQRAACIHKFSVFYPLLALTLFLFFGDPRAMVVFGGMAQAFMLPIISGVTLYFRYCKLDSRIKPNLFLDVMLWLASVSISIVAAYALWDQVSKLMS
jgi:Mn2+/Fe2+ NRAMP family transporter